MKLCLKLLLITGCLYFTTGCRSTKKLQSAINKKDSAVAVEPVSPASDSLQIPNQVFLALKKNNIDFKTFSAKLKVQYEDRNGKQPDVNAFIRIYADSIIWVSVSATFLNFEAFRILITPGTVTIMNKLDKTVERHPFSYIESIAHIPLNFATLQNLIIGNPIYIGDSIVSFRQTENHIILGTMGHFFKNLLTLSAESMLLQKSKLDDIGMGKNRTANLVYDKYESLYSFPFATYREITVAEKTKVDIKLTFKQYEFNKELSFPFNIPRNYKIK